MVVIQFPLLSNQAKLQSVQGVRRHLPSETYVTPLDTGLVVLRLSSGTENGLVLDAHVVE